MKVYCLVDTYDLKTRFGEYKLKYGFNDIPDRQVEIPSVPFKVIAPSLSPANIACAGISVDSGKIVFPSVSDITRYCIFGLALNGCRVEIGSNTPSTPTKQYILKIDNLRLNDYTLYGVNLAPSAGSQDILSLLIDANFKGSGSLVLSVGSDVVSDSGVYRVSFF